MSPIARAAEIWAGIESALMARGFWIRDEQRPELIRLVGRALGNRKTRATHNNSPQFPITPLDAPVAMHRSPPLSAGISQSLPELPNNMVHDPVLAAMLERSCSRRMGYDGDDEVTYGPR